MPLAFKAHRACLVQKGLWGLWDKPVLQVYREHKVTWVLLVPWDQWVTMVLMVQWVLLGQLARLAHKVYRV